VSLTTEERQRFLTSLHTDEAFREEVRRELLTEELLSLPQRFADFVDEVHAFVDEVHAFVDEVHAFVGATNTHFERLDHDVGGLKGMVLEQKVRDNPGYYLRRYAKRIRVVDLDELLDELGIADLSDGEYLALARTDVLVRGTSREHGQPTVIVVEATWRAHTGDIDRQVERRAALSRHRVEVLAVVVATEPPAAGVESYAKVNGILLETEKVSDAA
jgi:hypothetical protein